MKNIKLVLLVIFVVVISSCSKSNDNKPSKTIYSIKNHIKGSVKLISTRTYEVVDRFGVLTKVNLSKDGRSGEYATLVSFDENSNKTSENYYNLDGILSGKCTYAYDDKLNMISENHYNFNGILERKYTYEYDNNLNVISRIESDYDYNGKSNGKYTYSYTYDSKLNTKIESYFNGDGTPGDGTHRYTYDENSNLISKSGYDSDGVIWDKYTYTYDVNGNMKSEANYYNGTLKHRYTYSYNIYDKNGNWTKRTRYIDEKPLVITVRKIEYYNL